MILFHINIATISSESIMCMNCWFLLKNYFLNFNKFLEVDKMSKYNRLCVSISDETNIKLDSLVTDTNKKIRALSKSAVVEIALNKFLETATADNIADEISEQIVVDW